MFWSLFLCSIFLKVVTTLQFLKSYAEYPLHMQEKFARVAWYQEYVVTSLCDKCDDVTPD